MRVIFFLVFIGTRFALTSQTATVVPADIDRLVEGRWTGKLTYLDYSSNETTTIRTALKVRQIKPGKAVWKFEHFYPDEPHANHSEKVRLASSGHRINRETVVSRTEMPDGRIEIVTTRDVGKMHFRYTYTISENVYSVRKEESKKEVTPAFYVERNTFYYEKERPVTK